MSLFESIIGKLKREENYKLEANLNSYDLYKIISYRFVQIIRGTITRMFLRGKGFIFRGKNVKLMYKKYINVGRNCILEDDVFIHGLSERGIELSDNVTIAKGAQLIGTGVVRNKGIGIIIGTGSAIGSNNFIGGQGGVQIGENVILGPYVKIFSENHNINQDDKPIKLQGENRKGVKINNNCWIGAGVTILDGVELAEGTVVAAGAIVTKSHLEKNMIIGGIPAKIIKNRLSE